MSSTHSKSARAKRANATFSSRVSATRKSSGSEHDPLVEHVTPADGNIFADLGAPPAAAQNLLLRAQLMLQITRLVKRRNLTQTQAAKLFGVTQPRISDLLRGKIGLFSIDSLIDMLTRAGMHVNITLKPKAA